MEIVLLILAVPVLWLFMTPRRMLRRAGDWPLLKPALVGAVVLVGWMLTSVMHGTPRPASSSPELAAVDDRTPIERRRDQTQIYAKGDDQLRALLQ